MSEAQLPRVDLCLTVKDAGLRLGVGQAATVAGRVRAKQKTGRKMKSHPVPGMLQTPATVSFLDSKPSQQTSQPVQYAKCLQEAVLAGRSVSSFDLLGILCAFITAVRTCTIVY